MKNFILWLIDTPIAVAFIACVIVCIVGTYLRYGF